MKTRQVLFEGKFMNSYLKNRFKRNKNTLIATTGPTGSGKSLQDLKICDDWYMNFFGEPFTISNVCFSVSEVMRLLSSGKLRRGEIIILEEAGTSMGNLDFQNRISKLFTYVLQSFRTLQVSLIMNLPVLTMLNKSARQLIHMHIITCGIKFDKKISKAKCFLHQLNQSSGKSYWKYPRIRITNKIVAIQRLNFSLPPEGIINAYEQKKLKFLSELTTDFSAELDKIERDKIRKMARDDLSKKEQEVFELLQQGMNQTTIANLLKKANSTISATVERIEKKGFSFDFKAKSLEK